MPVLCEVKASDGTLVSINFSSTWHTINANCMKFLTADPEICSNVYVLDKDLGLVFPQYFVYDYPIC